MPVWRPHPTWFPEAVRSALDQQGCEIELIVVDDGNPEPVAEMLEGLDDPRLRIVRVDHGGVSAARNAGIAVARGEAIRFLDADDVAEPESTERLVALAEGCHFIAYGSTLVCDPQLEPERVVRETVQGDALLECVLGGFDVFITALLFPRRVVESAGGFDIRFALNEDYEYLLRALEHAPVRGGDFIATRYRRHGSSATASGDLAGQMTDMLALDALFARREDLRGTKVERESRAHLYVEAAGQLIRAGRSAAALAAFMQGLRRSPRRSAAASLALLQLFIRTQGRRLRSAFS
jgi:glycosyltransferase involved in cell wall biosynthesis